MRRNENMRCQKCGTPVGKDDLFCPECGSRIEQKSNTKVVVIAAVIMAAILAGIIFWVMSGSSGDAGRSETKSEDTKNKNDSSKKKQEKSKESTKPETVKQPEEKNTNAAGYILPESDSVYLTDADIDGLTLRDLNYAKNEIYARHGRRFKSRELQDYFNSQSWYTGQYDADDFDANYSQSVLNDYEKKNAELLRKKEFSLNSGGYPLDAQ